MGAIQDCDKDNDNDKVPSGCNKSCKRVIEAVFNKRYESATFPAKRSMPTSELNKFNRNKL